MQDKRHESDKKTFNYLLNPSKLEWTLTMKISFMPIIIDLNQEYFIYFLLSFG